MWARGLIGKTQGGGDMGGIRVHGRGDSNSVRGEGKQKRREAEDAGGSLLSERLFFYFSGGSC